MHEELSPGILRQVGATYAASILGAVGREYPNDLRHPMTGPDDRPTPREIHPAFYGCYDWHSSVEMHWALARLLRLIPDAIPVDDVRAVIDDHLTADAMSTEAAYFAGHPGFKRPYGWGWALMLAHELSSWDDADAQRWAANVRPVADTIAGLYLAWLPRATYPSRDGAHANSAFGLARAVPFAVAVAVADHDDADYDRLPATRLIDAIGDAARRWFADDADYPAGWEPSGGDFLSAALAEAELMMAVLSPDQFADWLNRFLPGIADGQPASLFTPAVVSDPTDGQIAHLHGLNLHRAYGWSRLASSLGHDDPRTRPMRQAILRHAEASLPAVSGGDYMVEHWLACYAVLLLTEGAKE